MVRKTKAEAQETRHQILDAAERVFLRQGVARTSLQHVASEAGLTRGAIYWHFKDKAALFEAMMDRVVLPCEAALASAMSAPPQAALTGLMNSAMLPLRELACHEQVARVFRIAMHFTEYTEELAPVQLRHQASVAEFIGQLEILLLRARQVGQLPDRIAPQATAIALFALVDGLMRQWTLTPGSFDLVQVGEQALGALLAGLKAA